ncbi:short chain dehydrogenase [Ktedonobacteria bacterium brp13]|nr:short chain dehydrogenase [Ktedonobacteria bacterium brp13]
MQGWRQRKERTALVTGGSRGIGAATALALGDSGYDVALTYRNNAVRANRIASTLAQQGRQSLAVHCDLTHAEDIAQLLVDLQQWTDHLDTLVLNASGGLEHSLVANNPDYPMHINHDAQLAVVDAVLPLIVPGGTIIFVTSHWAHFYGQVWSFPAYEAVAQSKYAGEQALRARQSEFETRGIRFVVVTGGIIEGTSTPKILERAAPVLIEKWRARIGSFPTADDMAREIASATVNTTVASGTTLVVGESLQTLIDIGAPK